MLDIRLVTKIQFFQNPRLKMNSIWADTYFYMVLSYLEVDTTHWAWGTFQIYSTICFLVTFLTFLHISKKCHALKLVGCWKEERAIVSIVPYLLQLRVSRWSPKSWHIWPLMRKGSSTPCGLAIMRISIYRFWKNYSKWEQIQIPRTGMVIPLYITLSSLQTGGNFLFNYWLYHSLIY